jgi:pimeloyl-ACP methyl ester carboxylesterase
MTHVARRPFAFMSAGILVLSACILISPDQAAAEPVCASLPGQITNGVKLTTSIVPARAEVPTYCKVEGVIGPALDFELRLPETWNGKLYYGGGGGYDGVIPDVAASALAQGYAEVASNGGHNDPSGMSAAFIQNDPAAAELFGSRSVPTVMAAALKIVTAAYGTPPTRSYFEGCSTGGREALMAVQRNPELFDGVIARAPAFNWTGLMGQFHEVARALVAPGGELTSAKIALIAKRIRDACDGLDGIRDGIVSNPAACTAKRINIAALRCTGGKDLGDGCLSDAQLAVVRTWTSDVRYAGGPSAKGHPLTGNEDDPDNFGLWASGSGDVRTGGGFVMQDSTLQYYLAHDPKADSLGYSPWDKDPEAIQAMAAQIDATQADIRPFIRRGGKLIVWQGGSDAASSVTSTIDYMARLSKAVGSANAAASTRLYVAPGVNHCHGGPGADETDLLKSLDLWVTRKAAPATLAAEKLDASGAVIRSIPLCQYPQYPRYVGPANDAEAAKLAKNYTCTAPPGGS